MAVRLFKAPSLEIEGDDGTIVGRYDIAIGDPVFMRDMAKFTSDIAKLDPADIQGEFYIELSDKTRAFIAQALVGGKQALDEMLPGRNIIDELNVLGEIWRLLNDSDFWDTFNQRVKDIMPEV